MTSYLKCCTTSQKITPELPVFLAGYALRNEPCREVLDDIYATVSVIQGSQTLCIIALDLLGGDASFVSGIKAALNERFGLNEAQVLINFSHTHCAVYASGENPQLRRWGYCMGQKRWPNKNSELDFTLDERYYKQLKNIILDQLDYCYSHLQPASLLWARGSSQVGINRRLPTEKGIEFRPNPEAKTDNDLDVFKLVTQEGKVLAVWFSYACHPTCMWDNVISPEYVGKARNKIEKYCGDGAKAFFLQGCCAEISPVKSADGSAGFKANTYDEMKEIGEDLADDVIDVLKQGDFKELSGEINTKLVHLRLFTEAWPKQKFIDIYEDEQAKPFFRRAAFRVWDAIENDTVSKVVNHQVQIWQWGDGLKWIALEGEVSNEYARQIKQLLGREAVTVLGYSNGVTTYVPTAKMLEEGGYETEAFLLHNLQGPLVPENENLIIGAICRQNMNQL